MRAETSLLLSALSLALKTVSGMEEGSDPPRNDYRMSAWLCVEEATYLVQVLVHYLKIPR